MMKKNIDKFFKSFVFKSLIYTMLFIGLTALIFMPMPKHISVQSRFCGNAVGYLNKSGRAIIINKLEETVDETGFGNQVKIYYSLPGLSKTKNEVHCFINSAFNKILDRSIFFNNHKVSVQLLSLAIYEDDKLIFKANQKEIEEINEKSNLSDEKYSNIYWKASGFVEEDPYQVKQSFFKKIFNIFS